MQFVMFIFFCLISYVSSPLILVFPYELIVCGRLCVEFDKFIMIQQA